MNDLKRLYQKPVTTQIKELKGNVSEDYDTLEEIAQVATNIPVASAQTLGGIKVGENLSITEQGVLSAGGTVFIDATFDGEHFTIPSELQLINYGTAGKIVYLRISGVGVVSSISPVLSFQGGGQSCAIFNGEVHKIVD